MVGVLMDTGNFLDRAYASSRRSRQRRFSSRLRPMKAARILTPCSSIMTASPGFSAKPLHRLFSLRWRARRTRRRRFPRVCDAAESVAIAPSTRLRNAQRRQLFRSSSKVRWSKPSVPSLPLDPRSSMPGDSHLPLRRRHQQVPRMNSILLITPYKHHAVGSSMIRRRAREGAIHRGIDHDDQLVATSRAESRALAAFFSATPFPATRCAPWRRASRRQLDFAEKFGSEGGFARRSTSIFEKAPPKSL